MKLPKKHYSNYLISVQFDNGFVPETSDGKIQYVINFLEDLGKLARYNGKRLFATYSIVEGKNGYHAHVASSWLPTHVPVRKTAKNSNKRLLRNRITKLLEDNYFYVDNPVQAIKIVTHNKSYVTDYIIYQPKDNQDVMFDGFYIHADFVPKHLEAKIHPYCSNSKKKQFQNHNNIGCTNTIMRLGFISLITFIVISYLMVLKMVYV